MEALTALYKTTPKKFDSLVDNVTGGQVKENLVKTERCKIIEEMKVPKARALLAKDESLMSDIIFKNFVTDGGLAAFYPSLDSIKEERQKMNLHAICGDSSRSMNLGYVVQNEYSVFPVAIFRGKEEYQFLKVNILGENPDRPN